MKAVIPAAGFGTRFLPLTKAQPKEMLPVVNKPTIQWVVEEAVDAGITDIAIITGSSGLIGSESVSFLANKFDCIVGIDNDMRKYFFGKEGSTKWNKKRLLDEMINDKLFEKLEEYANIKVVEQSTNDLRKQQNKK